MDSFTIRRMLLIILYLVNHNNTFAKSNVTRQILHRQDEYRFIAKLGIGSSKTRTPLQVYFLHLDTGSPLSWLQCEGCKKCFTQTPKPYPKTRSLSYHPIASSSGQCLTKLSDGKYCSYKLDYNRTSYTSGILAKETLFLYSSRKNRKKLENLVFGCGLDQSKLLYGIFRTNKIAGVLGLGRGPLSFLSQTNSISDGKFSYCFPHFDETQSKSEITKTNLRLGADAISPKHNKMKRTKLLQIEGSPFYYVEMDGISFNNQRLKIDRSVFEIPKNGEGGVVISSGSRYTQLATPAYNALIKELDSYFSKMKYEKEIWRMGSENFEEVVAYVNEKVKHHRLPTITFHFKGADLVVKPEALFSRDEDDGSVMVGMLPSEKMTAIGAFQQIDHWIMYDTKNNVLSFHEENCLKHA